MIALLNKGDALEYRCFRLLQKMGYFVRRQQGIFTNAKLNQVTDIDLYGIKFETDFKKNISIVESKNRKRTAPLDRILWLTGLKKIVGANSAFLFLPGSKWDIKDYAFSNGIKILDLQCLDAMEDALKIEKSAYYGLADGLFYEKKYIEWKSYLSYPQNRFYKTLEFLNTEARTISPHKGIINLFNEIKWISPKLSSEDVKESQIALWTLYDIAVNMTVFLLTLCEYSYTLNDLDREKYLEKLLIFGDWNPSLAEDLLKTSWNLAIRLSKEQFNKAMQIPDEFYKFPKPTYLKGVIEITERFCKNPVQAKNASQLLDMLLFEFLFKGKSIDKEFLKKYFNLAEDDFIMTTKQAKNVIELIVKYGAVPEKYFKPILDF